MVAAPRLGSRLPVVGTELQRLDADQRAAPFGREFGDVQKGGFDALPAVEADDGGVGCGARAEVAGRISAAGFGAGAGLEHPVLESERQAAQPHHEAASGRVVVVQVVQPDHHLEGRTRLLDAERAVEVAGAVARRDVPHDADILLDQGRAARVACAQFRKRGVALLGRGAAGRFGEVRIITAARGE